MVKRKDSASGGSIDDPTDNSSEGTESFLKPSKHDLVPLVLAILIFCLGLTAALLSFFLLQNGELTIARNSLESAASVAAKQLGDAITDVVAVVQSTAMMIQVSKTPITLYDQFEPYVMSGGSFPKYIDDVSYLRFVHGGEENTFIQEMLASGPDYANFSITGRDANNNPIPAPFNPVRCVVVQVVPTSEMKVRVKFMF
jgi:CHASE1-domain containing sensor protein